MALQYTDCKITIHDDKGLTIEYDKDGKTRETNCPLALDPFARLTVERLHAWVNLGMKLQNRKSEINAFDPIDLQVIGLNLYRILFGNDQVEAIFRFVYNDFEKKYKTEYARGNTDLRMRLLLVFEADADSLGKLPWEFLFVPGEHDDLKLGFFFAGKKTELILTRFVPPRVGNFPPPIMEKLRILVAIYNPYGLGTISKPDLDAVLLQMNEIPNTEVKEVRNLSYNQLKKEIATFCPHIFHFIGHGKDGKLSLVKIYGEDDYDESKEENQVRWVSGEEFKDLFSNDPKPKPRLVFLHACESASASSEDTFTSCARSLVDDIPAVVAMQHSISNQHAGTFATKFYEQLGAGSEIDEAVKAGRFALGELYPSWKHPRFATPVVYLQETHPLVKPIMPSITEKAGQQEVIGAQGLGAARTIVSRSATAPGAPMTPAPPAERDRPEIVENPS